MYIRFNLPQHQSTALFQSVYRLVSRLAHASGCRTYLLLLLFGGQLAGQAQDTTTLDQLTTPVVKNGKADVINITTSGLIVVNNGVRRYLKNVKINHQGVSLFCDQAVHQPGTSGVSGNGHVLLVQGDTITIRSDSMRYDATTRQATLLGRVMFQDRRTLLTTTQLDYTVPSGTFCYTGHSRLTDDQRTLVSAGGCYDTRTKKPTDSPGSPTVLTAQAAVRADSVRHRAVPLRTPATMPQPPAQPVSELNAAKTNNPVGQSVVLVNTTGTPSGQLTTAAPRKTTGTVNPPTAAMTARLPQPSAKPRRDLASPSQAATPSVNESDLERLLNSRPRPSNVSNFY